MKRRARLGVPIAMAAAGALAFAAWWGLDSSPETANPPADAESGLDARVQMACGSCHAFPAPEILPRETWRPVIEHMHELTTYLPDALPRDAQEFSVDEVAAWYEARAPEQLPMKKRLTRKGPGPVRFQKRYIRFGPDQGPGIATVQWLDANLLQGPHPMLGASNMMNGSVHLFTRPGGPLRIGEAGHPVRTASGDFDGDGFEDLVICDLGNPMPTDELVGRVLVARNRRDGSFEFETVLEGIARVADARPLDIDGDGDLDIVVAAFGWLRSGGIYLLHNETPRGGPITFRAQHILDRPGAVSVIPVENLSPGSGIGFAVAFSQHYEQVSVFHPKGDGYEERVIYRAPHPNWGTDNLEAVDLDGDSDTDFLLAHGDTLDDGVPFKFYHGVEWLENLGDGEFRAHKVGELYGAHSAKAADLDGDGDLDVVATGFLPQLKLPVPRAEQIVDSVVWYERTESEWIPWLVEFNHPRHTGMTLVDLDEDGRIDIVAGINRAWDGVEIEQGRSLEVWFNLGLQQPEPTNQ